MIKVNRGEEEIIKRSRGDGERIPVSAEGGPFLMKTAVDEELKAGGFEIIA